MVRIVPCPRDNQEQEKTKRKNKVELGQDEKWSERRMAGSKTIPPENSGAPV